MTMGLPDCRDVFGNNRQFFVRHIALLVLYATSCSAIFQFQETLSISLDGSSDIWQGSPSAYIRSDKKYRICADDIYWSDEIADAICRYRGFDGAMIVKEYTAISGYNYAVCSLVETGRTPRIVCDSIDVCDKAPVISCLYGFTGQCSSSQTSQDILPNEALFVLSPNFPDSFSEKATCRWTLSINVQESHNLEVTATADLVSDGSIEVSSKSGNLYTILYGTQGTSENTFYPYSLFQDTITVDFTSHGVLGGGSFLIRFSLTPSVVKSTVPPFVTDSSIRHTLASPLPIKLLTNSPDMPPSSPDSFPSLIGSGSTKTLPESARSINEQAIFAGVGVAVAVVTLLALGIIFVLFRGRIKGRTFAKSTAERPAGLVGYNNGVVDVVNTNYSSPTSLPSAQPGNEEENHIYATIPDDQYLVPDAFNNAQFEGEKLKDGSSAMAAERKLNDYVV